MNDRQGHVTKALVDARPRVCFASGWGWTCKIQNVTLVQESLWTSTVSTGRRSRCTTSEGSVTSARSGFTASTTLQPSSTSQRSRSTTRACSRMPTRIGEFIVLFYCLGAIWLFTLTVMQSKPLEAGRKLHVPHVHGWSSGCSVACRKLHLFVPARHERVAVLHTRVAVPGNVIFWVVEGCHRFPMGWFSTVLAIVGTRALLADEFTPQVGCSFE